MGSRSVLSVYSVACSQAGTERYLLYIGIWILIGETLYVPRHCRTILTARELMCSRLPLVSPTRTRAKQGAISTRLVSVMDTWETIAHHFPMYY